MEKTSVKELNTFLKGEYMAVDGYQGYIDKVEDEKIKGELEKIKQDHEKHTERISQQIEKLGGQPIQGVGMMGKMAEMVSGVKNMTKDDTNSILEAAYHGEGQGIKMAEEVIKGDLDEKSNQMISEILDTDREHLDTLESLKNG